VLLGNPEELKSQYGAKSLEEVFVKVIKDAEGSE
jgi:hypothetical protein